MSIIKEIKKIKIALLSSFTFKGIKQILNVECSKIGISTEFYLGQYNQYTQEILKKESSLYNFRPDLIIFFIDIRSLLGEVFFLPYQISDKDRRSLIEEKFNQLNSLIKELCQRTSAKLIFHNFEVPFYSVLGILENKQEFGLTQAVEELNSKLRESFKNKNQIFLFDYNSFCSKIGKKQIIDHKMYYLADIKVDFKYLPDLAKEYLSYIKAMVSLNRKCLVLDLDNTLWGGILGEDGIEKIKLGPDEPEGRAFLEFQKYILSLFNRGIILAINSKNNQKEVFEVFKKHPYMVLKEKHFAAMQINWNDKISNMKTIAQQLNISLDSLVFIDDSKVNREIVKKAFPEILVIDLPDDPALYVETLKEINDFNTFQLTEEDKKRGKMYAAEKQRKDSRQKTIDITEYFKDLETRVFLAKLNSFTVPRISQLTQRTNQFNMTTQRYLEEDIRKFLENDNYFVISAKVEDKFGDSGIAGTAIIEKLSKQWRIDNFLLSCRIIGREIEKAILAYIIEEAKKQGVERLVGEFIPNSKNAPAKNFYKDNNFQLIKKEKNTEYWNLHLKELEYSFPDFIKVVKEN